MPPWVDSLLAVLLDPRIISLAALALAWWSFRRTGRLTSLQTRLADLELKNKERIEAAREKAEIRATFYGAMHTGYQVGLENISAAVASDVDIAFLGPDPIPPDERRLKLPIPTLEPRQRCPLLAAPAMGCFPPFKVALIWKDPDGTPHRKETMLYESA